MGRAVAAERTGTYLSAVSAHVSTVRPEVSEALMSAPASRASWRAEALPSDAAWRRAKFSKERCGRLIAGRQWFREERGGGRRRREVRRVDIVNLSWGCRDGGKRKRRDEFFGGGSVEIFHPGSGWVCIRTWIMRRM